MSRTEEMVQDRVGPYNQEQDVPDGYKRTEVGVIPEDWEVTKLENAVSSIQSGKSKLYKEEGEYPFYGSKGLIGYSNTYDYSGANILIARVGSYAGSIYSVSGRYCVSDNTIILVNRDYDQSFLFHALKYLGISNIVFGSGQPLITGTQLKKIKATFPPLPEQRAIATALSDVDHLLESLDKLIAKKRAIKQAAMQELLTGKTRLPGFSGEWEKKRLGDVLRVCYGRSQSGIEKDNGRYPILATSGEIGRTDTPLYEKPSVLIGRKGTIDEPQYMDTPFWSVDTLFYTAIEPSNNARFIYYKFITIPWKNYNEASGVPSLHPNTIENILIDTPELEEQDAIVNILKDMDDDIEDLKKRRKKTQYVKQGMMQELLTGRTRLNLDFEGLKDGHDSKSGDQGNHNSDKRNETSRPY